jgi:Glyoxalase-like domain
MALRVQITFDCHDPDRLARFWATALGYRMPDPPDGHATWEDWLRAMGIPESEWNSASAVEDPDGTGPRLYFQRVPEEKTVKNRVHLDLNVGGGRGTPPEERKANARAQAERLTGEGATRLREAEERGEFWIVMQDPEGNEFCLQ